MPTFDIAVVLKPTMVKPLIGSPLSGGACAICDRRQSRWVCDLPHGDKTESLLCSLCILYRSVWGKTHREAVEVQILESQKVRQNRDASFTGYTRDEHKRLLDAKQADDVLGQLLLVDRLGGLHKLAARWKALAEAEE
jgi:hypothetical protein